MVKSDLLNFEDQVSLVVRPSGQQLFSEGFRTRVQSAVKALATELGGKVKQLRVSSSTDVAISVGTVAVDGGIAVQDILDRLHASIAAVADFGEYGAVLSEVLKDVHPDNRKAVAAQFAQFMAFAEAKKASPDEIRAQQTTASLVAQNVQLEITTNANKPVQNIPSLQQGRLPTAAELAKRNQVLNNDGNVIAR